MASARTAPAPVGGCGGCFSFFLGICSRGFFQPVSARHIGLPIDQELDEDGVRAAMKSVYKESDMLICPSATARMYEEASDVPFSRVPGTQGIPNIAKSFFQAKDLTAAEQPRKWLIVNLQHPSNTSCQVLNNIVWNNQAVKDLLDSEARLWQRDIDHPQARQYIQYYNAGRKPTAQECPMVAIIDPRTGRALRKWKAGSDDFPLDAEQAVAKIEEFLSMHTLEGFSPPESPMLRQSSMDSNISTMTPLSSIGGQRPSQMVFISEEIECESARR